MTLMAATNADTMDEEISYDFVVGRWPATRKMASASRCRGDRWSYPRFSSPPPWLCPVERVILHYTGKQNPKFAPTESLCSVERMIGRQRGGNHSPTEQRLRGGRNGRVFRGVVHHHGSTERSSEVAFRRAERG
jgi:hypothetical protein